MLRPDEVVRPETTAIVVDLKLGTTASIGVEADDRTGPPILWVNAETVQVLVMPAGLSEGGPLTSCDLLRADDLVQAATAYRAAIAERLAARIASAPKLERRSKGSFGQANGAAVTKPSSAR